ncbi:MCE family protein [Nocardia sp. ET3-3]|uniref:MCE family protein n=1 Tax=Nocardia terrae TaxID=2675851 RepID=A0A7K1UQT1_9NOCA|nr:MlaD family protein [Nocardia terrae]MVU76706.1 MCE family protein [Nocardia terrae]
MRTRALLLRVGTAVVLMTLVLAGVFRVVERPVGGDTDTYTALFTDANGVRAGDDVRLYGVQVGKVDQVGLSGSLARVRFTVSRAHPVFVNTKIAVRFQNLTGFRYLDLEQPDQPGGRRAPKATFTTAETVPAFDITTLFKGLQPVLAQLSPEDIDQFATSLLAVIQGDGSGLGPALGAIEKLSHYATDRQTVLSTLVGNLSQISERMGGKSGNAMKLLTNLTDLFVTISDKLPGLVQFSATIPPVLQPLRNLLTVLGVTGARDRDLDTVLQQAFPNPQQAVAVFDQLPGLIQTMAAAVPRTGPDADSTCSHGPATAPEPLRLLIAGQRITLCQN